MTTARANMLKQLVPGLHAIMGTEYDRYPEQHKMVYDVETSNRAFEEDLMVAGLETAREKDEGASTQYGNMQELWTSRYTHSTISYGFAVTEEAMEDNLYESVAKRGTMFLARSMAETKQVLAMVPLNLGFTSYAIGDGQNLFSTAHPLLSGATLANRPTTGADLNETSLEAAFVAMSHWTDDQGLLINIQAERLIVPPELEYTAARLTMTEKRPGTMDNDINAFKALGKLPGGMAVNNYLTDTNAWFIRTNNGGMKHFVRVKLQNKADVDFDTGNMKYKTRERYSFGSSDPRAMWGNPGST